MVVKVDVLYRYRRVKRDNGDGVEIRVCFSQEWTESVNVERINRRNEGKKERKIKLEVGYPSH